MSSSASTNPLHCVRQSCQLVANAAKHVSINKDAIDKAAESLVDDNSSLSSLRKGVEWDAEGWHYSADANSNPPGPLTCQYIFVMDSLNFCFWPVEGLEYDTLAISLKNVLEADSTAFDADKLAVMTDETLQSWFPTHKLPLLSERSARLRELGEGLRDNYGGLASNLVKASEGSAVKMVKLVLSSFHGFRDTSIYNGQLAHFYKRAQILVGDVWAAYGRLSYPASPYGFNDLDQLTMFADYRVPQILREMNIMQYSPALQSAIDAKTQIPSGSEEEVELRACTVLAVDLLQGALRRRGCDLLVLEVDWLLWQRGENAKDVIAPHHRTLTIYY